jgi:hypothetical protein
MLDALSVPPRLIVRALDDLHAPSARGFRKLDAHTSTFFRDLP